MPDKHKLTKAIDVYCAAWNELDPSARLKRLREVCADDVVYQDPQTYVNGLTALSDHIGKMQPAYPGGTIERTSLVDLHHHVCRFGWQMRLADGKLLPEGHDFVELSPHSKLTRISGFFGPLRPRAPD